MNREERREYWRKIVAEQEGSGLGVRAFCARTQVGEHSFYAWRGQLRRAEPVRFALVEPRPERVAGCIEVTLASGEQLRIPHGADAVTVRLVLAALRA